MKRALLPALILFLCGFLQVLRAAEPEWRGLWVDAWNEGFHTPAQVQRLVAEARAAGINALFVQVRRRGDVYFHSALEPWAAGVTEAFDPLARLLEEARAEEPPLEVHAWLVISPVWPVRSPSPPPEHILHRHPEWLTRNDRNELHHGRNYAIDPGHPEVQQHLVDLARELVDRYAIHGVHLDHIRYDDRTWGYNEVALGRFQRLTGRGDRPAPDDSAWLDFRRRQVTDLVRQIYLTVLEKNPACVVSAAVNTRAPGIRERSQWASSASYSDTLQDWRAWLEEGIVDLATPMTYVDAQGRWATSWDRWSEFAKDHRYDRQVAMGVGLYVNTFADAVAQICSTREPTPAGNRADGVLLYSYAAVSNDRQPRAALIEALSRGFPDDPAPPVFGQWVQRPAMPWKTDPGRGHLAGKLKDATGAPLDGVPVMIRGPVERVVFTSATGFWGAVDLPPGRYQVETANGEGEPDREVFEVAPGRVNREVR
jgi:uncharacterized lipoprotein YddW (UPF0748 family)